VELTTFFRTVVTSEVGGWFCLGYARIAGEDKKTKETWKEEFFSWPDELPNIINRVHQLSSEYDVYFSPYLFSEQRSLKEFAIVGKTIVADLDEANVLTLPIEPSVLVETSQGRHQGYWILREELDTTLHERLSKRLTYSIPRCDKTGWFLGKKVRVPETTNNKYISGPQIVRVVSASEKRYTSTQIENIASVDELYGANAKNVQTQLLESETDSDDFQWAEDALNQEIGPQEMLARVRNAIPTVVARYNLLSRDRSAALWALNMSLFRAGMKRDQVFFLAYHSPNNKFKDLRYGCLRELAKDVLRAELATKIQLPDVKSKIRDARKLGDSANDKNEYIAKCAREHLDKLGSFIHCSDGSLWFVRNDNGRPISISSRSEHLLNLLDNIFGINASDREATYVAYNLEAMVADLPVTGKLCTLTHYDHELRMFVMHTGGKDVLVVTKDGIRQEVNGFQGLVFPWTTGSLAISPNYGAIENHWGDELFDDCLDNIIGIDKINAKAILKVWFLAVLLRDAINSRPILALFGQPGSGKSTLFRRVYTLLYGKDKGLNTITKEDHFDYALAKDPLVVFDNADSAPRWLPDRLAATVAPTEITKRKLFTDNDIVILRRQAMLGITAHNPKFTREDVTDRLLLLTFERLEKFKPESAIYERISKMRNLLWGGILRDVQKVLGTEVPRTGYPQFRIEDFAQFGYWIATALGVEKEFYDGIDTIRKDQKSLNIEEDILLVSAIERMLTEEPIEEMTAGQLWNKLRRTSRDEKSFAARYQNAVSLGRKIWILLDTLREIYDVQWSIKRNVRTWTIRKLPQDLGDLDGNRAQVGEASNLFGTNHR
jgi:hypothetical protein